MPYDACIYIYIYIYMHIYGSKPNNVGSGKACRPIGGKPLSEPKLEYC